MKTLKSIALLLLLSATVEAWGQHDIYSKYATHTELKVAFVSQFQLDSATTVDVTLIQARDFAGWAWMVKEFNINESLLYSSDSTNKNLSSFMWCARDKNDHKKKAPTINGKLDYSKCCEMYISKKNLTISIFHIVSEEQSKKLALYQIELLKYGQK